MSSRGAGVSCIPTPVACCDITGEKAGFWLKPEPGMDDRQIGGLFLLSVLRGLGSAMKGEPQCGVSCDIHPDSILAIAGRARGVPVGPVVFVPNACLDLSSPTCFGPTEESHGKR